MNNANGEIGNKLEEIRKLLNIQASEGNPENEYAWYVGATGNNDAGEYTDFSDIYISEKRWENRYDDRFQDEVNSIKVGDRIALKAAYTKKKGLPFENNSKTVSVMGIKAIGIVTGNSNDGKNIQVEWTRVDPIREWYGNGVLRLTIHLVKASDGYIKRALLGFTFGNEEQDYSICEELYSVDDSEGEEDLSITEPENVNLKYITDVVLPFDYNRVVFGAPGTGKSFTLKKDCEKVINDYQGEFERVTFHPDYSYSQFVGTYKPITDNSGKIKYEYVPGPFVRVLVNALKSAMEYKSRPFILVIEEINRAKVAAVFGDIFQLLDRDDDGASEYEIQTSEDLRKYLAKPDVLGGRPENYQSLRIPNNMFVWATMNSADQGVFPMDTAFKRRWSFEYLGINSGEQSIKEKCVIELPESDELIEWNALRKAINDKMSSSEFKVNEDKLLGPYFISKKVIERGNKQEFIKVFLSKVIMYLYEDAVKQRKSSFFDGCPDTSRYSSICDYFLTNGIEIFGKNFKADYYDKYKG